MSSYSYLRQRRKEMLFDAKVKALSDIPDSKWHPANNILQQLQ